MKFNYLGLIFIFLFSIISSSSLSMDLPAVSSENVGSLVKLNITQTNGTGKIYFSIPPYNGISYQESFTNALKFIESQNVIISNKDYYIDFYGEHTSSVEGASGGVATAILLKSLSENAKVNDSVIITGEINSLGQIFPVGGIPEKMIASYFNNKSIFLIPNSSSITEKVIVKKLSKEFVFPVYEYSSFNSAYNLYISNSFEGIKNITLEQENLSNVYDLNETENNIFFNGIVSEMLNDYYVNLIHVKNQYPEFVPYFESIYNDSFILYEKGYSYSAGNELFLSLETMSYLLTQFSDEEFNDSKNNILYCLNETNSNLNYYNGSLEYYVASESRYVKSKDAIETYLNETNNTSSKIYFPGLLTRSELWCNSAQLMSKNSDNSHFNKEDLGFFVKSKLVQYISNSSSSLDKTRALYSEGYYGAALNEIINYESMFIECENYDFEYSWPKMMYSHSIYLNSSDRFGNDSYYEISKYACSYDRVLREFNSSYKQSEESTIGIYLFPVLLILILFILSIIYIFLKFKCKI